LPDAALGATLLPIGPETHVVIEEKGPNGMPEVGSPSVRRRRLAAELRRLREERNQTGEDVAESLGWSASKLSRIELARTGIKAEDLTSLLTTYGVPPEQRTELLRLVEKPRSRDWWRTYTDALPEKFVTLIGLESDAQSISAWSPELVPGLLQTANYARAAIAAHMTATAAISAGEIERRVQTRLRRQHLLTSEQPTNFSSVLDESVLLRHLGSPRVMRDQLAHLLEMARLPNVTLRVLPLRGAHPIGTGAFILLRFAPMAEIGPVSDIVYLEQLSGSQLYVDDDTETHQYELGFGHLVADSLEPADSCELIARVMRETWSA
jgi:transcriptional regulator with XRE-family HTH domain